MIHSMAGGKLQNIQYFCGAKVKLPDDKTWWYINSFSNLKVGDIVLVPFENQVLEGKVVKIENEISSQVSPVPYKRMKEIIKILS